MQVMLMETIGYDKSYIKGNRYTIKRETYSLIIFVIISPIYFKYLTP